MRDEDLYASGVKLTEVVRAKGAVGNISTVGEAVRFMKETFTLQDRRSADWRKAAIALTSAAAASSAHHRENATKEFVLFLRARGMLI